jgi:hypothetical protein
MVASEPPEGAHVETHLVDGNEFTIGIKQQP